MMEIIKSSDKSSGTNGNCVIHLNGEMGGEYYLYSFIFNNNLYNVNSTNNRIVIANTSDVVLSNTLLTEGFYSGNEIATNITNNVLSGFSASYNENSGKFTFTYSSDFKILNNGYDNTSHALLGFANSDYTSSSNSLSSVNVADLTPYKNIFISIRENSPKQIVNQNHHDYSFIVHTDNSFGSLFKYIQEDKMKQQKIHIHPTRRLEITIYDSNDNQLNVADWSMIVRH